MKMDLVEYEQIVDITSRLIVNPVSYRMKDERISEIVERIADVLKQETIVNGFLTKERIFYRLG